MRPVILQAATASNGLSPPCPLDRHISQFEVMLAYEQNGATAQCTVQWSPDSPWGTFDANGNSIPWPVNYNTNANWYDIAAMSAKSTDAQYTLGGHPDNNYPAQGVRLKTNAYTSGQPTLTIVQAGN